MRAIVVEPLGDPEVLRVRDWPSPTPRPGQVLIKVSAAGVNFADIMGRRAGYLAAEPPLIPGMEVAGTVLATGAGVEELTVGQRVCALTLSGGYAELAPPTRTSSSRSPTRCPGRSQPQCRRSSQPRTPSSTTSAACEPETACWLAPQPALPAWPSVGSRPQPAPAQLESSPPRKRST